MKLTKIVCSIGLKTEKKEYMEKLVDAGMNMVRLNFSHGDHEEHGARIKTIREIMKETGKKVAILQDNQGPEIRTGQIKDGGDIMLEAGQKFTLTTDTSVLGDGDLGIISVQYDGFARDVKVGNMVLIDDGLIGMEVEKIDGNNVHCIVKNGGELGQKKTMNIPGAEIKLPSLFPKDIEDLKFGCQQGVDYYAASFIRKKSDVEEIRRLLDENGGKYIKIICKIENQEGLDNFEEIFEVTDGIMVARGDLGVEIPMEEVPVAQKMMIQRCNESSKLVITATQMLDSMMKNPRPTRAEAADITNAILDGTDAIMLSGETAKHNCPYPVEAVEVMTKIANRVDHEVEELSYMNSINGCYTEAIAKGAVEVANEVGAKVIIVASVAGRTVRKVRKHFPTQPILVLTQHEQVARQVMLIRGAYSHVVSEISDHQKFYDEARAAAKLLGLAKDGDVAVVTAGGSIGDIGITDMLKIIKI